MNHYISDHCHILYDPELLSTELNQIEQLDSLFNMSHWREKDAIVGSAVGRGTTWFIRLEQTEAALRHYHRGGILGKVIRDHYLFTGLNATRSFAEYKLLSKLYQSGVNVPRPIAAKVLKRFWGFYQADIITERVQNACDLVTILQAKALDEKVYQRIGQEIAKMHATGINHTDLNIHNILVDNSERIWLIDFDKCYESQSNNNRWKDNNIARLYRSFVKEKGRFNIQWNDADFNALLTGYHSL